MPYAVSYHPDLECILVQVAGLFDSAILQSLASQVASLSKAHQCPRIKNDLRHAQLTPGVLDVFTMPAASEGSGISLQARRALWLDTLTPQLEFMETVFMNHRHRVRLFTDREAALAWLQGHSVSAPTRQ